MAGSAPGTGKSHLASALGLEAVKAGKSVAFITLADLIGALAKVEREGTLRERLRFYCRPSLLIVDEIGYLRSYPVAETCSSSWSTLATKKGAMMLTSNRGFAEWDDIFGSPVVATALLDRLLHHGIVIQIDGSSYRLRRHADLLTEHIGSRDFLAWQSRSDLATRILAIPGIGPIGATAIAASVTVDPNRILVFSSSWPHDDDVRVGCLNVRNAVLKVRSRLMRSPQPPSRWIMPVRLQSFDLRIGLPVTRVITPPLRTLFHRPRCSGGQRRAFARMHE